MNLSVYSDKRTLGKAASGFGSEKIKEAIEKKGEAFIILATGASQFEMLEILVTEKIEWDKVTCFHLDEYVGINPNHPASFSGYLQKRFVEKVGRVKEFHYIRPDLRPPEEECERLSKLINNVKIDVGFIGIGENGHLAFNDPPADFSIEKSFIVAELDDACRRQQQGEGWFASLEDVPTKAVTMTIPKILASDRLVITVPDQRKARAVQCTVDGEISPDCPASILQGHGDSHLFLDKGSASLLKSN